MIILQSINTHATDWLSRWIWSLSMVHHRTASKKICLHVQRKYICVSCNRSIRSTSDLRTFDNRYLIINFLQVLLPKITLRIHAVSRHKRDSSDGKKSLKIRFPITLYVHMYVYNIIPDNTSVMFCKSFEVLKHNLHVETWLEECVKSDWPCHQICYTHELISLLLNI